ncbi:MAG: ABC transporter ATP-binding protein [Xanthobacteraceae bacterium]
MMSGIDSQDNASRSPPAGQQAAVDVKDLHVRFNTRDGSVDVVNGVSFSLAPGKVLAILGESGSGKSVTLRALMRLLPQDRTELSGTVRVAGHDIAEATEAGLRRIRGREIAMIFQEPMIALDPVFTIGQQIIETIMSHEDVSHQAARQRARDLLDLVQIPSAAQRLKAYPHEMSGGMRQRAMIALALSCRPSVLLADEPTTALDVTVQIQIILLLRRLQQELGMAVVFVTHDVGAAVEIADDIAVMYAGRFVEIGATTNVIRSPSHPYTAALLNATALDASSGGRLDAIPGMPPDLRDLPEGCSFAPRCRFAEVSCTRGIPPQHAMGPDWLTRCYRVADGSVTLRGPRLSDRSDATF